MPSPPTEGDDRQRFKEASGRTLVATSIVFDGETYRQMERDGEMESSIVLAVHGGWVVVESSRIEQGH